MIIPILVIAFILRIIKIDQSLWLDESINVMAAKELPFWEFVSKYPIGDFHPPLYFGLLWIWGRIFGLSELSVRMPSVILGVATVYITYLLGRKWFSQKTGIIVAILMATAPLHVYYSQEARMYSLAAFSVTLSFFALTKVLERKKYIPFYALSLGLVLYSDYLPYLILPVHLIYVCLAERKRLKDFLVGFGISLVTVLPWLFVFPEQLINGRQTAVNVPNWAKVVGGSNFSNLALVAVKGILGRISFEDKTVYTYISILAVGFYGGVILNGFRKFKKELLLLSLWLVFPVLTAFLISFFIPVLSYFRMVFILPALYLLVSWGLINLPKKLFSPITLVLLLINFLSLFIFYTNPQFQRENWKGLVTLINSQENKQNTAVLFENNNLPAPFRYYDPKTVSTMGALKDFPATNDSDVIDTTQTLNGKSKILLVDYLVEISDSNRLVDKALINNGWRVTKVYDIPSLGFVYEYTKQN